MKMGSNNFVKKSNKIFAIEMLFIFAKEKIYAVFWNYTTILEMFVNIVEEF
jgi:hypothetical protein